ncbi:MAG: hypothetical protein KDA16_15160, partial [Phycisphaerales bacterium]|nr:hypothetical protein [Phycisphaerales bacterium]
QYVGKKDGEVFVGNTDTTRKNLDHLKSLKTLRLGDDALDINGKKLPRQYRPIFISKAEEGAYDRIMVERFSKAMRGTV